MAMAVPEELDQVLRLRPLRLEALRLLVSGRHEGALSAMRRASQISGDEEGVFFYVGGEELMSHDNLDQLIAYAYAEGYALRKNGYGRPIGGSSLEDIKRDGWDEQRSAEGWQDKIRVWRRRLAHGKFLKRWRR